MSHLINCRGLLAGALACWFAFLSDQAFAATRADLILTHGRVYTDNPKSRWAEAVAVKGEKIVYVGTNSGANAQRGHNTKEIDLGGRLLLPGFIDPHDHVYGRTQDLYWANLGSALSTHTLEVYREHILEFRARNPNLQQLRGIGFDYWILPAIGQSRKRQPRELLDDIVSDVPALIKAWGGHLNWANSKALELAGITKTTPDPPAGQIGHDPATGEPNGLLYDRSAENLVLDKLPQRDFTVEQHRAGILSWQREIARQRGITGVLVPTHYRTPNFFTAMQQLSDGGLLTARYRVAQWKDDLTGEEQVPELVAGRAQHPGGRYFKLNTIKIFAPWPQDQLNRTVAALDKQGFQVFVHNTGTTESYAAVLDAFEYALKQNGRRDSRHIITHMRAASAPLAARFKALGVRGDADWNMAQDWYLAPKAFYEAGAPMTLSSDYWVRDPSPLPKIAESAKHGVPVDWLIDCATIRGAEAQFAEKETGSIAVGKAADLIVLDKDFFKISPQEIESDKVLLTLFAGKELYRDPSF